MMDLKVTYRFLVITACLITSGLGLAEPSPDEAAFRKEVENKHAAAIDELGEQFSQQFEKKFPNHKIFSHCTGSFKNAGYYEYALGVLSPSGDESRYIVFLNGPKEDNQPVIISSFKPKPTTIEELLEGSRITCESIMGLKRLNNLIKGTISIHGGITPINNHDGICVGQGPTDNTCYAYDVKKKKFIEIGGWTT